MRTKLGTFRYPVKLGDARGERFEALEPWVDTGAIYSQFPASLLANLGDRPNSTRGFILADGTTMDRPVGPVQMRVGADVQPVLCVYGEEGSEMLLGATTLEIFGLAADPVNHTLVPVRGMMLSIRVKVYMAAHGLPMRL